MFKFTAISIPPTLCAFKEEKKTMSPFQGSINIHISIYNHFTLSGLANYKTKKSRRDDIIIATYRTAVYLFILGCHVCPPF